MLATRRLRGDGCSIRAVVEHSAHFSDLFVNLLPLRGEVLEGSIQDVGCELLCHVERGLSTKTMFA